MFHKSLLIAAAFAVGTPAMAFVAQAQAPKPGAAPARPATPPNRAALTTNLNNSFKSVDLNGDGALSTQEITAAETRRQQALSQNLQNRVAQEFSKLDTDKNGQLSLAEFRAAAPQPKPVGNAAAQAIQKLDTNKDGKVSADEYRAPMLANFDKYDTNKDGVISPVEQQAAQPRKR